MRCKACNKIMNTTYLVRINNQVDKNVTFLEDLCGECRSGIGLPYDLMVTSTEDCRNDTLHENPFD